MQFLAAVKCYKQKNKNKPRNTSIWFSHSISLFNFSLFKKHFNSRQRDKMQDNPLEDKTDVCLYNPVSTAFLQICSKNRNNLAQVVDTRKLQVSTRMEAREYLLTGHLKPGCRDNTVIYSTWKGFWPYDKALLKHTSPAGENSRPGYGHETDQYSYLSPTLFN